MKKLICNVAIALSLTFSLENAKAAAYVTYDRSTSVNTIRLDANGKPFSIPVGTLLGSIPLGTSNTIRNGIGAPAAGLGIDGDFYIQTDVSPQLLFGPKASGVWPAGISLGGPAGPAGPSGPAGSGNFTSDAGSSVDSQVVIFNGTSGGHAKAATDSGLAKLLSGVLSTITDSSGWLHDDGAGTFVYSTPSKTDIGLSNVTNSDTTNAANIASGIIGNQRIPLGQTNAQTANYTLISGDSGKLVTFNGVSLTGTLPASPPNSNWNVVIENLNSTSLTISRNGLTINGGTSNITLPQYGWIEIRTDGTNYFSSIPLIAGSNITLTPAVNGLTIASTGGTPLLFSTTSTAGPSATVTETSLKGTVSPIGGDALSANYFTAGKTVVIEGWGYDSTSATAATITFKLKLGSTVLLTSSAITPPNARTNDLFRFRFIVTCRTTGATGTVFSQGTITRSAGTSIVSDDPAGMVQTTTTTVDTTVSQTVNVTATLGAATAGNSWNCTNMLSIGY